MARGWYSGQEHWDAVLKRLDSDLDRRREDDPSTNIEIVHQEISKDFITRFLFQYDRLLILSRCPIDRNVAFLWNDILGVEMWVYCLLPWYYMMSHYSQVICHLFN